MFNPHCEQCDANEQVKNHNPVVDVLRNELERSYRNNDKLLDMIFDKVEYEKEVEKQADKPTNTKEFLPILPKGGWSARKRMLEEDSRNRAIELARLAREGIQPVTPITEADLESELEEVRNQNG